MEKLVAMGNVAGTLKFESAWISRVFEGVRIRMVANK